jgi:hypothetical protein
VGEGTVTENELRAIVARETYELGGTERVMRAVLAYSEQQAGALVTLREALEKLISAVESDGVPGYIYDETKAECGQCGASAPTIAEVKHADEWCFQRAYEVAGAALAASAPAK